MCPLQKAGLFDCLTNRIQRSHSDCFHTQALKLLGFHFLSLGMLTLEIQPPCCKEAQAAHDKTHVRGTEDPRTWFGLNSRRISSTNLPATCMHYRGNGSTSPQSRCSSWSHFSRRVVPVEPPKNGRFMIKRNYCCFKQLNFTVDYYVAAYKWYSQLVPGYI